MVHTHCLKTILPYLLTSPPSLLQAVPSGDWFCPSCRPKQRSGLSSARQRSSSQSEEEEEEEEEEELVVKCVMFV
jgi:hypothetical protein